MSQTPRYDERSSNKGGADAICNCPERLRPVCSDVVLFDPRSTRLHRAGLARFAELYTFSFARAFGQACCMPAA